MTKERKEDRALLTDQKKEESETLVLIELQGVTYTDR